MDLETATYITTHFSQFLSENESKAWRHWSSEYKLAHGIYTSEEQKEIRRKSNYKKGWMTEDPAVLKLLSEGIEMFKIRTAERILDAHKNKIYLNLCPKCSKLARTSKAKQCRHCGHDWH